MKKSYLYLLAIIAVSIFWGALAYHFNLFASLKFRYVTLTDTYAYVYKSARAGNISLEINNYPNVNNYSILCIYANNSEGRSACDIVGLHKIQRAKLLVAYYEKNGVEDVSDTYLKELVYEDEDSKGVGNGIFHTFSVSDEQIELSKEDRLGIKSTVPVLVIITGCLWSILWITLRFFKNK